LALFSHLYAGDGTDGPQSVMRSTQKHAERGAKTAPLAGICRQPVAARQLDASLE
jgi:hypothetical protein